MKYIKKLLVIATALFAASFFTSCYTPNPLYGTWTDLVGNTISFQPDLSMNAKIVDSNGDKVSYSGSYSVYENILSLEYYDEKDPDSINKTFSEWDIRGAILYLTWTSTSGSTALILGRTGK